MDERGQVNLLMVHGKSQYIWGKGQSLIRPWPGDRLTATACPMVPMMNLGPQGAPCCMCCSPYMSKRLLSFFTLRVSAYSGSLALRSTGRVMPMKMGLTTGVGLHHKDSTMRETDWDVWVPSFSNRSCIATHWLDPTNTCSCPSTAILQIT